MSKRCGCGHVTVGDGQVPEHVKAPVQYGPRVAAMIVYLYVGQFLPKKRTAQALSDLFGAQISQGTVAAVAKRAGNGMEAFTTQVADRLSGEQVVHFDETGFRVVGKLRWVLRQKVSGTMRTKAGAEAFCAIRSYLATAAKHGLTHFAALARLAEGNPWLPEHAIA